MPGARRSVERKKICTVVEIFAHLHNNRLSWIRNSALHLKCPAPLAPARRTIQQASAAHLKSAAQCLRMLQDALSGKPTRLVKKYSRGNWAPTWPATATMFAYMLPTNSHHRGQILPLAHQLGHALPDEAAYGLWRWDHLWKQLGYAVPTV